MSSQNSDSADLVVVGAGPGGYVAAIRATQNGRSVVLVDADAYGGTCLNYGCIPSKALISGAETAYRLGHSRTRGIYGDPFVDTQELSAWQESVVKQLTGGVESLCARHGIEFIQGRASFTDEKELQVDGEGSDRLTFEDCIIATGSKPIELPGFPFDDDRVLDSKSLLGLESLPAEIVVVGAGYIGLELSTALAKLGTDVTVLEALDSILPAYGSDLSDPIESRATDLGIEFRLNHTVDECELRENGVRVHATVDGTERTYESDMVLVAVGRHPVTDNLGLEKIGVETDPDGFIATDEQGQTNVESVYAIGDVAGEPMLAHAASAEGKAVAAVLASNGVEIGPIPSVVFTDPEIATVGCTPEESERDGEEVLIGECRFQANGRALTRDESEGFVRLVGTRNGTLIGAQIVGPEAAELISVPTMAMSMDASFHDLGNVVYPHPSLSEAIMEAAESALDKAIHTN